MKSRDIHWFRHDTATRQDHNIQRILAKFGCDGYGLFWVILESFYKNNGIIENDEEDLNILKIEARSNIDIKDFMRYCVKIELFQLEDNKYTNQRISEFISEKTKESEVKSKNGKLGAEIRHSKQNNYKEEKPLIIDPDWLALQQKQNKK